MSIGYSGFAYLVDQDADSVMYSYGCSNLNDDKYMNLDSVKDGLIIINKNCLVQPEIHRKLKRFPNGRKRIIEKRIPIEVPITELLVTGKIVVENSKNCWRTTCINIDFMAVKLIRILFSDYQLKGYLPENITIFI